MAEEGFKRKLAAILSADVEGYSRLMDDDEEATVRTLKTYRAAINDLVQQYRGRIVDLPGDNILAEFNSVVDAVNCAVEIQRDLAERNTELAYNRQMQFRIGVNLGDVIEDDGNIYGDGVNIAARVESLAEAGGICISGRAYDQVLNKLGLEYENLGEHEVKNISVPIRVYRVLSHPGAAAHRVVQAKETLGRRWRNITISAALAVVIIGGLAYWQFYMRRPAVEPASVDKMAFPLPEKPSIAVLPFVNMSEDPKQEYLSDGITEQIISTLSKVPSMFVIARTSTFAYKNKPVKVQQVSQDLGVRYMLEGSVQRSGDRVRITAQLIDAIDGKHMWSQRYDRELKDIFILQDEITLEIIRALRVKLTVGEQANLSGYRPNSVEYAEKFFEGVFYLREFNKEANLRSKQLFTEAIDLEPEFGATYAVLASSHVMDVWLGSSNDPRESLGKAFKLCKKAISLDEKHEVPHFIMGHVYLLNRKYDMAIKEGNQAIALNPNSAEAYVWLAMSLVFAGRPEEAIDSIKRGMRLSPFSPAFYIQYLAIAYREAGLYEEAIVEYKRSLKLRPNSTLAYIGLSYTHALAGRYEEAREAWSEVLKIDPKYSFEKGLKTYPFRPERVEIIRAAMDKAGLPFKPPLPLPDKPSIAVLAFDNLSGDPEQEYFSDGISENIITALSKVGELFVIARNSSFTYKGKPVKVQQVGRELGVRYVLEGSVQKSGDRVRITAQLVDAKNGQHLWAERYDRGLKDIFALQDQITMKVVTALRVVLSDGEQALLKQKVPQSLEAYLKVMEGRKAWLCQCKEGNDLARNFAAEAIALDPKYSAAYSLESKVYFMDAWLSPDRRPFGESVKLSVESTQKAIELDPTDPEGHGLLSYLYLFPNYKLYENAIAQGQKAIELSPNSSAAHFYLGTALTYDGRYEEAVKIYKKMFRLNPKHQNSAYHIHIGLAYICSQQYDLAISEYNKATQIAPNSPFPYMMLAPAYTLSGQEKKARTAADKLLELNPKFSIARYEKRSQLRKKEDLERIVAAMRKAGLPE